MNNALRLFIFAVVVGGLAIFAFLKLKSNQEQVEAKVYKKNPDATVLIQADTVEFSLFEFSTTYLGSFAPNKEAMISSEAAGRVIQSNIQEGSNVSTGQIIAQLDTEILKNQLKIAETNMQLAEKTAQRMNAAAAGLTEVQIDNSNNQVNILKYQIEVLKKQISMATIKAPFSGIITAKYFEMGSLAGPGAQMAMLTDISTLKLEVNIPEQDISKFKSGMKMNVSTDVYPGHIFSGTVGMIGIKADATKNYTVKILVSNTSSTYPLKAGMYGSINFTNTSNKKSVSIPRSALVGSNKEPQVFLIKDGVVIKQSIQIGESNENSLQVISGLNPNDIIATSGLVNLAEGVKVTIAED